MQVDRNCPRLIQCLMFTLTVCSYVSFLGYSSMTKISLLDHYSIRTGSVKLNELILLTENILCFQKKRSEQTLRAHVINLLLAGSAPLFSLHR